MKQLTRVVVFGSKYRIKLVENLMAEHHCYGRCHKHEKLIEIDASLNPKAYKQTLLHELGHALIHEVGADQGLHWSLEEVICEAIAKTMADNLDIR